MTLSTASLSGSGSLVRLLWLAAALGAGGACSSGTKGPDAGGTLDAASEQTGETGGEAGATMLSCQDIRLCVAAGGSPDSCAARGTAEAKASFQSLLDCLAAPCPDRLLACVCRETCQADGYCLDQTDACAGASATSVDAVCNQYCGG